MLLQHLGGDTDDGSERHLDDDESEADLDAVLDGEGGLLRHGLLHSVVGLIIGMVFIAKKKYLVGTPSLFFYFSFLMSLYFRLMWLASTKVRSTATAPTTNTTNGATVITVDATMLSLTVRSSHFLSKSDIEFPFSRGLII